jgi:L-seryl-tRNA(Ser) seleniumtransferase
MTPNALRNLPSVDRLLQAEGIPLLLETFGREAVLSAIRAELDSLREGIQGGDSETVPDLKTLVAQIGGRLEARFRFSLRPVINATGVILHTNLGRAPLAQSAFDAMQRVGGSYSNLEFDLSSGKRGKRESHVEEIVADVMGAEAAMVVNNTASAVLLSLSALAQGREVIISRGQLIEIGGGFRMPEVMAHSGVHLVEVGTTNRTRLSDYERAITDQTALLMRAHFSNFRVIGFTEETPLEDIARLAHERGLLCIDDLGSGALLDTAAYGLAHEPTVGESLAAGVDAVMFSGDKLLGGPQAGIIVGKKATLDILKRHPLARAVRVDKLTIAALVATLDHYRRGQATSHIPIWQMIAKPLEVIRRVAESWATEVPGEILPGESTIGGGSLPGETLPTLLFSPQVEAVEAALVKLRAYDPPIIARLKDDRLLLDPRTVMGGQVEVVATALGDL